VLKQSPGRARLAEPIGYADSLYQVRNTVTIKQGADRVRKATVDIVFFDDREVDRLLVQHADEFGWQWLDSAHPNYGQVDLLGGKPFGCIEYFDNGGLYTSKTTASMRCPMMTRARFYLRRLRTRLFRDPQLPSK
jgi:hypothetical protein